MRRLWARSSLLQIDMSRCLLALRARRSSDSLISWDERGRALYLAAKSEFC